MRLKTAFQDFRFLFVITARRLLFDWDCKVTCFFLFCKFSENFFQLFFHCRFRRRILFTARGALYYSGQNLRPALVVFRISKEHPVCVSKLRSGFRFPFSSSPSVDGVFDLGLQSYLLFFYSANFLEKFFRFFFRSLSAAFQKPFNRGALYSVPVWALLHLRFSRIF